MLGHGLGNGMVIPQRNDLLGDRHPLHGVRGQSRMGALGGGVGGLMAGRRGGGLGPLGRYADPGVMADPVGLAGLRDSGIGRMNLMAAMRPVGLRPDILNHHHGLADLLRGAQYPDLGMGRRAYDDLHLSSRYGPYGLEGLLALNRFDRDRGLCDGRGCRGGLGCGHDRRCEHERCIHDCNRCSSSSSSSTPKDLKTKDILIRGKTYKVRKSFLAEAGKFEADIGKYLEKKSEETVPNNVVEMLIDFINTEECNARTLLDLVTLNVLASNLGVKSMGEVYLSLLKKHEVDYRIGYHELTQMCVTVLLSGKVDDKLMEWLKKYLKYEERYSQLGRSLEYQNMRIRKPELEMKILQLLGLIEKDESEDGLRIL
jgi:hypothetical protein